MTRNSLSRTHVSAVPEAHEMEGGALKTKGATLRSSKYRKLRLGDPAHDSGRPESGSSTLGRPRAATMCSAFSSRHQMLRDYTPSETTGDFMTMQSSRSSRQFRSIRCQAIGNYFARRVSLLLDPAYVVVADVLYTGDGSEQSELFAALDALPFLGLPEVALNTVTFGSWQPPS
jgi:hypothetical protein